MLVRARTNVEARCRRPVYSGNVLLGQGRGGVSGGLSVSCTALNDHIACLRRRSYAGKPSVPQYGVTAAAFKQRFVDIQVSHDIQVNNITCLLFFIVLL